MSPSDRSLKLAACWAALVPCLLFPISNPDLFWHLSAARRMLETGAIPDADWLSATRAGSPWVDFEWLSQLLFRAVHPVGGMAGLWLLKILLLSGAAGVLWALLGLYAAPASYRAAALALWSAGSLTRSDIRPELFSVLGFGATFWALEARRLGRGEPRLLLTLFFYGAWANLHAGFAYGLLLIGIFVAAEAVQSWRWVGWGEGEPLAAVARGLWRHLAAAAAGTLLQPAGPAAYGVLWRHWLELGPLTAYISEWGPIRLDNPWHWPAWAALFLSFGAALAHLRRRRKIPLGPLAALLYYGWSAFQHARLAAYFSAFALPLALRLARGILPEPPTAAARRVCAAVIALSAAFLIFCGRSFGLFTQVFHDRFVPLRATAFLERERAVLGGRPLYNPWGWGGYLGWRLYPAYKVFQDGRYIFHPLLEEAAGGIRSSEAWQAFLDRCGIETALLENIPLRLPTTKRYPDGSTKPFARPYYVLYMPKERWALVHWDEKALVFVLRSAAPSGWLKAHEYRYARPFDDEALREALALGELPAPEVEAEFRRHEAEAASLGVWGDGVSGGPQQLLIQ